MTSTKAKAVAPTKRRVVKNVASGKKSEKPSSRTSKRSVEATRVAIIGGGRGGKALMEIFADDPLVNIVGLAEKRPQAVGYQLAQQLGIPVTKDYRDFLSMKHVDLVIDVTGKSLVAQTLQKIRPSHLSIIGGASAKFMWQLIEARIRATTEIEKTLTRYQSLFRRYVKEEAERVVSDERTRIACEIHDGLVQTLVGVNFKIERCGELAQQDPAKCRDMLIQTKAQLKHGIHEARQVVFSLRPGQLEKLELSAALNNFLSAFQFQNQVKVDYSQTGEERHLDPKTKVFLFRIVQEALTNAHKHAKATQVNVRIDVTPDQLTASIADNGGGFDVEAVMKDPDKWDHFGLRGMKERARLLGGEAQWQSEKGRGTTIAIHIPLST